MWAYDMLRGLFWAGALPPLPASRWVGRRVGGLLDRVDPKHHRIVRFNLARSFPEASYDWVEETARGVFHHLGMLMAELPRLVHPDRDFILERSHLHGREHYEAAHAQGKGVLMLTGHFGNWEWASQAMGYWGIRGTIVARKLDWPPLERLVTEWRTAPGHEVVPKAHSARAILRSLKRNSYVGLLVDQNVDWYDGVWVDFFGRPACTNKGTALLAMSTGAPVITYYNRRAPDGSFDVYCGPEIPLVKTGDKTNDVWANTQNYAKALEDIIREQPEQWFWLHQRWKTRTWQPWPREKQ